MAPSDETREAAPASHPVASLLTDEMRERVRAATFERPGLRVFARTGPDGSAVCPIGVALGRPSSPGYEQAFQDFGVSTQQPGTDCAARIALRDFMYSADSGEIAPSDVKRLLGVVS